MAAGDILYETGLFVKKFTVKANEDIEKGELCYDDGNGVLAATATSAAGGKVIMALEAHDYSEETQHEISCVVRGFVEAQKISGSGAANALDKLAISATAGEVTKFVKGTAPGADTYATTGMQTALDTNLAVIGHAVEASLDVDTTQKMFLGA